MTRRRYIQLDDGELYEVTEDWAPPQSRTVDAGVLWGDRHYDGLRATDGTPIDSRTKHREYMKRMGYTMDSDFKETWQQAAKRREAVLQGADPTRKRDLVEALHKTASGYRPKVRRETDPL